MTMKMRKNALSMISILMCFKRASGLQVNYHKSSLYGVGVETDSVTGLANLLGCKADKLPAIFLGIPVGSNLNRIEKWGPIAEKFRNKLSNWKAKTLSIGGRLTIVTSVLGGVPNYWMSMFPVPKGVVKDLEKMRKDFFWGKKEEGKAIPWISWNNACKRRENGGLGIIGIEEMNLSLMAKWVWRFKKEKEALWVRIIKSIHGDNGSMNEEDIAKMHSCTWKSILLRMQKLDNVFLNIPNLLQVEVGNGEDTYFWEDKWHDSGIMKDLFRRLYALETEKKVKAKMRINIKVDDWERRRRIRDGREREEANRMEEMISSVLLSNNRDTWRIPKAPKGSYSTAWFRSCMETHKTMGQTRKDFWNKWIPKKHNILVWRLVRDRIPTRVRLAEMGIDIPCTLCPMCEEKEENLQHLFLECPNSSSIWSKIGNWWSITFPEFQNCEDPLIWTWYALGKRKEGKWLRVVIVAAYVTIWRFRNGVVFNKEKVTVDLEFKKIQELAFHWLSNRNTKFDLELCKWMTNPNT